MRESARSAGVPTPEVDARLDLAMNDFARALGPDDMPAPEAVDFLLAHYGLPDPPPHWLIERATLGSDGEVARADRAAGARGAEGDAGGAAGRRDRPRAPASCAW